MTEREKIAQIIAEHLCPQGKAHKTLYGAERMCYSRDNFAECEKVSKCVDALIAAGLKFDRNISYTATFNLAQLERINDLEKRIAKAEHRAEVAERALLWLCDTLMSDISAMVFPNTKTQVANKQELYDYCIEQAERELAEEGKDD